MMGFNIIIIFFVSKLITTPENENLLICIFNNRANYEQRLGTLNVWPNCAKSSRTFQT